MTPKAPFQAVALPIAARDELLQYLQTKPYVEVAGFINYLAGLPPVPVAAPTPAAPPAPPAPPAPDAPPAAPPTA